MHANKDLDLWSNCQLHYAKLQNNVFRNPGRQ